MTEAWGSWGRYPRAAPRAVHALTHRCDPLPAGELSLLPHGRGRSYGDSCQNGAGMILPMAGMNRFIGFNPATGRLQCEAGVTLREILELVAGQGWFLPVVPGTWEVTVGGAIANDVHGKNHHVAGCFGNHVRQLELLRSDGRRLLCSPRRNAELFRATVGGLGLTGVILWAELELKRIHNPFILAENIPFANVGAFFRLAASADHEFEYTVAWIDCLARGKGLGRGVFMGGNHAPPLTRASWPRRHGGVSIPFTPPFSPVNRFTLVPFNGLYYHWPRPRQGVVHFRPFFFPLDAIGHWNRLYGPRGFLQYQCVIPRERQEEGIRELLDRIAASGQGSFLAVVKVFGDQPSPGLLSFPRPGATLALDFPFRGEETLRLLDTLDTVVAAAGGSLYPAKDARMSAARFQAFHPAWERLAALKDPRFSSTFWRRVTQDTG